jgi:hypothetical protein
MSEKKSPKILNIDALAKPHSKELVLKGSSYPVPEMTVQNFLDTTKAAEEMVAAGAGARAHIEETIRVIVRSLEVKAEQKDKLIADLGSLDIERLGIIVQFIQGDYDPNKDAEVTAGNAAPAEAPAK